MFALRILGRFISSSISRWRAGRVWAWRTLIIGPSQPVDGDSVACTKALLNHLRKMGKEAYTLPTLTMHAQIEWVLEVSDLHPACLPLAGRRLTTRNLQQVYDAVIAAWKPDEIILVDGPASKLGFDPRGVPLFTIDHHMEGGPRDDGEAYIQPAPATGCLLAERFGIYEPILAVSILTDTYWLRQNQPSKAIEALALLRKHGLDDEQLIDMQRRLLVPKDPTIIDAVRSCQLRHEGEAVVAVLSEVDAEIHRGVMAQLGYYFRHICVVRGDGYVSFKTTDQRLSLRLLAERWGGGGHDNMAAGRLRSMTAAAVTQVCSEFLSTVRAV